MRMQIINADKPTAGRAVERYSLIESSSNQVSSRHILLVVILHALPYIMGSWAKTRQVCQATKRPVIGLSAWAQSKTAKSALLQPV